MDRKLEEISIELSNRCLLKCIHCSSGSSPEALKGELKYPEVWDLIRQARELGAIVLSLSGGDPALQWTEVLGHIGLAYRLGYERVLVYTTGVTGINSQGIIYGLTPEMMEADTGPAMYKDVITFIFSLHSHRQEVHDYIMGQTGVWDTTVYNIKYVKSLGYNVEVHAVPMLPNYRDMYDLYDLLNGLGVSKMSLLRFVPQTRGMANNRRLALNIEEFTQLQGIIDGLSIKQAQDANHVQPRAGCPIDFRHAVCSDISKKLHPCHAGKDLILVRPRGDVHPCAAWKSLPETDNVRDKSLKEIWETGEVFQTLREYHDAGWKQIRGACASCRYQPSCKSGCPAQRFHALKLAGLRPDGLTIRDLYIDSPDPLCPVGGQIRYGSIWRE